MPTWQPARNFLKRDTLSPMLETILSGSAVQLGNAGTMTQGICVGKVVKLNQEEIMDAIDQANKQLGGTWRLPTIEELESLVCADCGPPKIREKYFPYDRKRGLLDRISKLF